MNAIITPSPLSGAFTAPPSKSAAHRAVLCAALAKGNSIVRNIAMSADMIATIDAVGALGASVKQLDASTLSVTGISKPAGKAVIDCNESGSTLRFILPVAAALGTDATFTGKGALPSRPISPLYEQMIERGCTFDYSGTMPFSVSGGLTGGSYSLAGNISSQFISGLLFALPLLSNDSEIMLTSPLESRPYADMTVSMLGSFGIEVMETQKGYFIRGGQSYSPADITVEGDYSSAAFFLCSAAISGTSVTCKGLLPNSLQGDRAVLKLLNKMGADVVWDKGEVTVTGKELHAINIDARQIPDLIPALCAVASVCGGTTRVGGAERLRIKESDRIDTTARSLSSLGADITALQDGLAVSGKISLSGGTTQGFGDHRIVMSAACASCACENEVVITGAQAHTKSYPGFFDVFTALGGRVRLVP